jgi:hypothetical protein
MRASEGLMAILITILYDSETPPGPLGGPGAQRYGLPICYDLSARSALAAPNPVRPNLSTINIYILSTRIH